MTSEESKKKYNELFSDDKMKAKAFDMIAEKYYFGNFGQMQKSDLETLLFSIYLDKMLDKSEEYIYSYSDYQISKILGITQSKVENLKVKKELLYHYEKFDWRKSFNRLLSNARYENEKIKLYIPDKNLFNEVKNAIEENGGFVEVQLTKNLLQIRVEYYVWLIMVVSDEKDKKVIVDKINKELQKSDIVLKNKKVNEPKDLFKLIMNNKKKFAGDISINLIRNCVPYGEALATIIESVKNFAPDE